MTKIAKLEEKVARLWPMRRRAPMFARALRIAVGALQREHIRECIRAVQSRKR